MDLMKIPMAKIYIVFTGSQVNGRRVPIDPVGKSKADPEKEEEPGLL
jgi:hypothetical protein